MEIEPMDAVEEQEEKEKSRGRLNSLVAVTVALLATFMGICHVRNDMIVQEMQQARAERLDAYNWYQARNIREDQNTLFANQLRAEESAVTATARPAFEKAIASAEAGAKYQDEKKTEQLNDAKKAEKYYDSLNVHDDQFHISDAFAALAVSLLAITALTQKKWLYGLALIPTIIGVFFGIAGLLGLSSGLFNPDHLLQLTR